MHILETLHQRTARKIKTSKTKWAQQTRSIASNNLIASKWAQRNNAEWYHNLYYKTADKGTQPRVFTVENNYLSTVMMS